MSWITVVTSGKGGAGKSTVSAGLGSALAKRGRQVLLIDGDAGLRSLDLMLGVGQRLVYDLADIFDGVCEPIKAIYPVESCKGLYLVPAPASLEQLCSPGDMARLCRGFACYFDDVIIDCPAGVGTGFETAVAGAKRALVVSTPDMVCARAAHVVGDLLDDRDIPSRLVINRLRPAPILSGKMPDVDDIIDTAGIQLIGLVPEDDSMAISHASGAPLSERCAARSCFENIAGRYLEEDIPLAPLEKL